MTLHEYAKIKRHNLEERRVGNKRCTRCNTKTEDVNKKGKRYKMCAACRDKNRVNNKKYKPAPK